MTNYTHFNSAVVKYGPRFQSLLGLKGFHVDGMFGNFGYEDGGLDAWHEKGLPEDKGGISWAMWTGSRRRAYEAFCLAGKLDPRNDDAAYAFVLNELKTTHAHVLDALRATRTRDDATRLFMVQYEAPGVPNLPQRIEWAKRAESARVAAEQAPSKPPMTDTPADPHAALLAAVEGVYNKLLDFIAAEAVAKGVPQAAVSVVRMLLNQFDVPKLILAALLKLAAGAPAKV